MSRASRNLGIIGLCTGWAVPVAGIALGIIGLSVKKDKKTAENDKALNVLSIIIGAVAWAFWYSIF